MTESRRRLNVDYFELQRWVMGLLAAQPDSLDLFWLPLAATVLGAMILTTRNPRQVKRAAAAIVVIGVGFVALSPLTVPGSPSSAFGQLLLLLAGPSLLIFISLWWKLRAKIGDSRNRSIIALQCVAALWLVLLWVSRPEFAGQVNSYWLLWWSTTLLLAAMFMFIISTLEKSTASLLYAAIGIALLLGFSFIETTVMQAQEFRDTSVEAFAIMFGALAGIGSGIICWFAIVQKLHKDEADFPLAEGLSDTERAELEAKLAEDLEWLAAQDGDVDE